MIDAARQRGLEIPRDLSIIAFDDTPVATHVWPPLKPIAGENEGPNGAIEERSTFASTLIPRDSAAAPAG